MHTNRGIAVADGNIGSIVSDQSAGSRPTGHSSADNAHVENGSAGSGGAEQANIGCRQTDREIADRVAQTVEGAGKGRREGTDWRESGATIPIQRWRRVDVAPKSVISGQCAVDPLQIGTGRAAFNTERIEHLVNAARD